MKLIYYPSPSAYTHVSPLIRKGVLQTVWYGLQKHIEHQVRKVVRFPIEVSLYEKDKHSTSL